MSIAHPLTVGTKVTSTKPPCPCKGKNAPWVESVGVIKKVINNHSGVWYFLDIGTTVKSEWITKVHDS